MLCPSVARYDSQPAWAPDRVNSAPVAAAAPVAPVAAAAPVPAAGAAAPPPTTESRLQRDGPSDVGCSQRRSIAKATCSVRSSPSRGELSPLRLALVGGMSRVALCCVVDMIWIIVKHLVDFDRFRRSSSFTLPLPVSVFIAEKPPCGGLTTYTQPRCTRDHPLAPEEHLLPPLVRVL